jgi:hypothetical protein
MAELKPNPVCLPGKCCSESCYVRKPDGEEKLDSWGPNHKFLTKFREGAWRKIWAFREQTDVS